MEAGKAWGCPLVKFNVGAVQVQQAVWQRLKEKKGSANRNREEMAKVLVVVTSHSDLGDTGKKTGKI
jgi:hypothetical protein